MALETRIFLDKEVSGMAEVWIMGELLVEIMRQEVDQPLDRAGLFRGPFPSGAPAICADTIARLGHTVGLIGGVGQDDFGRCLLDRLADDGVDCSAVLVSDQASTGCAFVTYHSDGSRKFIYHIKNTPAVEAKAPDASRMQDTKYFHIMGCSLMADQSFGEEIVKTMQTLHAQGVKITFDPNIRPELFKNEHQMALVRKVLAHTQVFLPGVNELLELTGQSSVEAAVKQCFEYPEMTIIVLKKGSQGCAVYTRQEAFSMGVYPVCVMDPTGAGDCFDGAFLCGLLEQKPLREAAQYATAAAALNTAAFGPMEGNISVKAVSELIHNGSLKNDREIFL